MPLLYRAPEPHYCSLPEADGLRGSVATCAECEVAYIYDPIPWEREWRRLFWYHRKARRNAGLA